jgi:hypothetical protein
MAVIKDTLHGPQTTLGDMCLPMRHAVGLHPIVSPRPACDIQTSRKTHWIPPNWDVNPRLCRVGGSNAINTTKSCQ